MTETDANTAPPAPPDRADTAAAVQAQIDAATQSAGATAVNDLATSLGFNDAASLSTFITEQREASEAAKTEEQKRSDALTARETAAAAREAAAASLINRGTVNLALVRAGVAPDSVDKIAPLVSIDGDITDESADAAVAALRTDATFAALFAPTHPAVASGVTSTAPAKGAGTATVTAFEAGVERYKRRHPTSQTA